MNLNALSTKWLEANGSAVGFTFKSTVTGKIFKAVQKMADGKFVCVLNGGTKSSLLDATVDRYVMHGGSSRISEINKKITDLETKRDALETEIEALYEEQNSLEDAG